MQVCIGLQTLIGGAEGRGVQAELQVLSSTSTKFLPALFSLLDRQQQPQQQQNTAAPQPSPLTDDKVSAIAAVDTC